ncbi:MAG: cyclic nucleotide-binding protein, partial [Micavibrio aeruginosavorus]
MIAQDAKTLADDFRTALGTDQLSLHYQPVFKLEDSRLIGFEALMRWNHPSHGMIPPSTFIPVAEQSGLIVEASRWAVRESCRALDRMGRRAGFRDELFMSVNFSAKDFAEENFLDQLYTIISETDTA